MLLSACGGQGKSLAAELLALFLQSLGFEVQIFSADVQQRLTAKLGDRVVTIDTDLLEAAAEDPLAFLRAFLPVSQAVTRSATDQSCVLLDTAATWDVPTIKYLHDMGFDRSVAQSGGDWS